MKFQIYQNNTYKYERPVRQSINQFRLRPVDDHSQTLLSYQTTINPFSESFGHIDYWGNYVETFYLWGAHDSLTIETMSIVETQPLPTNSLLSAEQQRDRESEFYQQNYAEFLVSTQYTDIPEEIIKQITDPLWDKAINVIEFVQQINAYLYHTLTYTSGATTVKTKAVEVLEKREGVCQDYTHVMLALCRYRGIPTRYVSGYIYVGENAALRGDAATHAWVEFHVPTLGWIGIDPTNNVYADQQHIKLATGRDYTDITPLKGVYLGSVHTLDVQVSVKQLVND
ncbi:transglutaminase domain-containing protein [Radiobacillus sp. PE A8.2]|uniref:transglutaminase family protein n=1 Tax=Radiobacillus sp. PE A8.2 TaxID=3380349 RepID=UPI0038905BC9